MENVNIGIIGGSGLYQMPELENVREAPVETPFGSPSDVFVIGELDGADLDPESELVQVGKALIYHYASGSWSEVQEIQQLEPDSYDRFGASVAVSGRFAIVAAPGRDGQKGAIFFFERDVLEPAGSQWSQSGRGSC